MPVLPEATDTSASTFESCHLLIVEDSETQAMRLRLYFEAIGWEVTWASTGQQARQLLEAQTERHSAGPFDLLLLDYHLPDAHGDEIVRELRAQGDTVRQIPVLLLTASAEQDTELRVLRSGADDYVSKTAPIDVLITRLQGLLRKSRAHAELSDRYEREHRVAHVLQESLLSAAPPDTFPDFSVRMAYEPAWDEAQIGGDFYDIRSLRDRRAALIVGDVAGKGLAAATFTAEIKYSLRAFLHEHPDPAQALTRLNNFLVEDSERNPWSSSTIVAVCVALCDTITGQVQLSAAGAEPPLILRRDPQTGIVSAEEVPVPNGMLLGVTGGYVFETLTLDMLPGDVLLFFTDGITEARQRRGPLLGQEGLAAVARRVLETPTDDMEVLVAEIVAEAKRVSGGQLLDDACIIATRWNPTAK
jgi:serine phosphatase RsbU (regulator of sigma subunit)